MTPPTVTCKNCHSEISAQASICPSCGASTKKRKSWIKRVLITCAVVLLVTELARLMTDDDGTPAPASANIAVSANRAHRVNEPVSAGTMEWEITGVRVGKTFSSDGNSIAADSDQSVLVLVSGTVTNRSNDEVTHIGNLYLVDRRGSRYGEKDGAELITDPLTLNSFNPNVPKKFTTIFEVPRSAVGLQFEATDFGPISADTALIDLGLTFR